ncbi:alpha-L-rhamnosidase C-terminal domain-containing protein [Streptomyces atroolivaceus]|uniref:alpha-L-rhamnosidase C-terminal domain-containing protein n=1 Tax=Streptomyces atroolivaceus TaxID=66869 RepID=UPI0033FD0FF7
MNPDLPHGHRPHGRRLPVAHAEDLPELGLNRYAYGSEGRFGSAYGRVATRWRKDADGFALRAVLPANTTAEVWVPGGDRRSAGRCPAAFQRLDVGGGAVSTMGSGTHHFAASD